MPKLFFKLLKKQFKFSFAILFVLRVYAIKDIESNAVLNNLEQCLSVVMSQT